MSELKKMTKMGSDVRKLAALLQAKAPKGEMLAYINPREVAILKAHGGKGEPHEDTGIPSFAEGDDVSFEGSGGEMVPDAQQQYANLYPGGQLPAPGASTVYGQSPETGQSYVSDIPPAGVAPVSAPAPVTTQPTGVMASRVAGGAPTPVPLNEYGQPYMPLAEAAPTAPAQEEGIADKLAKSTGMSKDTLARLGIAGGFGLLGAGQARRAQQQGQQATQQMQQLAAPYQQAGQAAQAAAQRGELMPVGQQSLQAAQAQIAQDIQRRGGVGAQQAATQIEALRQQLLQQQYDYGLKLSGIGDQIAIGAIKTGIQADQYANQLTQSYFGNILRSFSSAPQTTGQQTTQPVAGVQ